jgi:hypothetical protein
VQAGTQPGTEMEGKGRRKAGRKPVRALDDKAGRQAGAREVP